MDIIFIRTMQARTLIGVYPWEREAPQQIELDLDVGLPNGQAAQSDSIDDTIHYGTLVERLRELLAEQQFLLLEALAEFVANVVLQEFKAPWVRVSIVKPGILPEVGKVGITIERSNSGGL